VGSAATIALAAETGGHDRFNSPASFRQNWG
jgi:hypothetical protein